MPVYRQIILGKCQWFTAGDLYLLLYQVYAVIISVTGCSTCKRVFISKK